MSTTLLFVLYIFQNFGQTENCVGTLWLTVQMEGSGGKNRYKDLKFYEYVKQNLCFIRYYE